MSNDRPDTTWLLTGHPEHGAVKIALEWYGPWRGKSTRPLNGLARLYRMWGKLDKAVARHNEVISERKRAVDYRFLGETYLQFGELEKADEAAASDHAASDPAARHPFDRIGEFRLLCTVRVVSPEKEPSDRSARGDVAAETLTTGDCHAHGVNTSSLSSITPSPSERGPG